MMSDTLNRIMESGYPQGSGPQAKYVFSCPTCGAQVISQNSYGVAASSGTLQNILSTSAQQGLSRLLWRIPIFGSVLASVLGGLVSAHLGQRQAQNMQQQQDGARRQAFDEVRNRFAPCTTCGALTCASCSDGGLCRACAAKAKGGTPDAGAPKDPTKMWD